jgi:hypothetical protein
VTDNAANMKNAFVMVDEEGKDIDSDDDDDESHETNIMLKQWTVHDLKFDGWVGCAAHQMQLVVNDGYKELKGYRRVQAVFAKARAISTLSRRSSHFAYSLSLKIPSPNDTRWNSHFKLHQHIVNHFEDINIALEKIDRNDLIITKAQKELLSQVTEIMQYFSEATNILQSEGTPTLNRVIPVIDSLENALFQCRRENAAINALAESLLSSLSRRFDYLLTSAIHQAATALDPRVKLSFADLIQKEDKRKAFIFCSGDVKLCIKSLLPSEALMATSSEQLMRTPQETHVLKKPKLLDFCSVSNIDQPLSVSSIDVELQTYLDLPRIDVDPVQFWIQRNITPLSVLALQLLSIPCSSAPVERLFSKAGIILNQRRTRTSSLKLEKLLFFK